MRAASLQSAVDRTALSLRPVAASCARRRQGRDRSQAKPSVAATHQTSDSERAQRAWQVNPGKLRPLRKKAAN